MIHPSPVRGDGWLSGCSGGWGTVHRGHRALQRGDGSVCAESLHRCAAVPRPLAGEARREAPQPFGPVQRGGRKDCVPPQAGRESAAPLSALLPDYPQAPKGKCAFAGLPASAKREVHFWRITCKRQKGSVLLPDYLKAPKWKGWVKEIGFSFMFNRLCLKGISPPLMRLRHRRQSAAVCRRGFCGLLIPRHSRMRHILILQLKNLLHMGLLLVG